MIDVFERTWMRQPTEAELQALIDLDFDVTLTGFSLAEVDFTLDAARERDPEAPPGVEDEIPAIQAEAVTRMGDVWVLGRHRLICGDARDPRDYARLLGDERVDLVFTDPPYNVPIDGHVCGSGRIRHREFAMGVGEMSQDAFTGFLTDALKPMAERCRDGAIAFVCMDWRHMTELLNAGSQVFTELKNLCVWNKTNGGMGTFYRSKHELVFVYKVGTAAHTNTFGLGDSGRYRTNVWDYAGISSMGSNRAEQLAMHPTVKPTAMVADAIRDCSMRGDIVLDGFGGSGTTLIAAETCGRAARLIEFDPHYCDVIIRRFERLSGKQAVLQASGALFDDVLSERPGGLVP
jgi:DNA modification methylase